MPMLVVESWYLDVAWVIALRSGDYFNILRPQVTCSQYSDEIALAGLPFGGFLNDFVLSPRQRNAGEIVFPWTKSIGRQLPVTFLRVPFLRDGDATIKNFVIVNRGKWIQGSHINAVPEAVHKRR